MLALINTQSEYSLLQALPRTDILTKQTVVSGYEAIGLADGPALYGALEFYQACLKAKVKPILGIRFLLRFGAAKIPMLGYMLDEAAYRHGIKLSSAIMIRAAKEQLEPEASWAEQTDIDQTVRMYWLIDGSEFEHIDRLDTKVLNGAIAWIRSFAKNGFGFAYDWRIPNASQAEKWARAQELQLVAAPRVTYIKEDDREAYLASLAIKNKCQVVNLPPVPERRSWVEKNDMETDAPTDAIEGLAKLVEASDISIPLDKWEFPAWTLPEGVTSDQALREASYEGAAKRVGELTPQQKERLEYEMDVIIKKGYSTYFLVVADIVMAAKEKGIATTTRGSAAGSFTSFCLGITTVNPLTYQLPFERFLNPFRPSLPDIDMDFADNRRHEMIDYVKQKYGEDHVAQIGTFGTLQARAVVRDVGRALGYGYGFCDGVAKMIPMGKQGFPMTLERALEESPGLREQYATNPDTERLIELSKKLEGNVRHTSVHAAGVVIGARPVTDFTPIHIDPETGQYVTQYDMTNVEKAGLVKMDFLGIRNLTIMQEAANLARERRKEDIYVDTIPINDALTLQKLTAGETSGLFQLNGAGMTRYLKELKPTRIEDIMIMVALYRPGPMEVIPEFILRKNKESDITYPHPNLAHVLDASLGLMVYQDDIIFAALYVAGYNWEEADKFRKAVGKKIPEEMAKQKIKFYEGCKTINGMTESEIDALWKLIEPFAAYGFNKAHACSYGMFAYQTAYLKAHYPEEYMLAVLNADIGHQEKTAEAISECRRLGFKIMPPCVNKSQMHFSLETEPGHPSPVIRTGLLAIKNLGVGAIESILAAREKKTSGHFSDLGDFLDSVAGKDVNKKSLESLAKAGAFSTPDTAWGDPYVMLGNLDHMIDWNKRQAERAKRGQVGLFADSEPGFELLPGVRAETDTDPSTWERELLGFYVAANPMAAYMEHMPARRKTIADAKLLDEQTVALLAVRISDLKPVKTKAGEAMLIVMVQDESGGADMVLFPKTYAEQGKVWSSAFSKEEAVLCEVKVSHKTGETRLSVQRSKAFPVPELAAAEKKQVTNENVACIRFDTALTKEQLSELQRICRAHPGGSRIALEFASLGRIIETNERVTLSPELKRQLRTRFGAVIV